jgi:DNA-binding transcriptional LysR family regulator
MELKWLEDYLMLAREGSFSRAASLRNVTQPAFSRRIRALEDWLGATLFDRSSTPVTLTRHGEEFQKHARQIVEEALAVRADFRLAQRADDQLVRIVALNSISVTVAPGLIAAYRANRPKGRVELISLQGLDTHYDALDAGAAHVLLAFGRAPLRRRAVASGFLPAKVRCRWPPMGSSRSRTASSRSRWSGSVANVRSMSCSRARCQKLTRRWRFRAWLSSGCRRVWLRRSCGRESW